MRLAFLAFLLMTSLVLAGGHGSSKGQDSGKDDGASQGKDDGKDAEDDPRYEHAVQLKEHGKLQQAAELFQEITKDDPEEADAWYQLGVVRKEQGDLHEADYCLNRAVELEPSMADAWSELGLVQLAAEKFADAGESFQKAIKLEPNDVPAIAGLGEVALKEGKFADAEKHLKSALKLDPDLTGAYVALADVYLGQGKPADALVSARSAFECESEHAAVVSAYAAVVNQVGSDRDKSFLAAWKLERAEKFDEAEKGLKALTAADPNDFRSFAVLGDVYLYRTPSRPKEAITAYLATISIEGKAKAADKFHASAKAEVYEGLGRAYLATKEYDRAEQALKSGQKLQPHIAYFPYYLACVAADRSKAVAAVTELKNALELDPELVAWVREEPAFNSLKSNAAFQQLLAEYGSSN